MNDPGKSTRCGVWLEIAHYATSALLWDFVGPLGLCLLDGACFGSRLHRHAGLPGAGVSAAEGANQAEQAMAEPSRAFDVGFRNRQEYQTEPAQDALRSRPDYQVLIMDLNFPNDPIAIERYRTGTAAAPLTGRPL